MTKTMLTSLIAATVLVDRMTKAAALQDKFEPVLDAIQEQQPGWGLHDGPQMDVAWEMPVAAGLDLEKPDRDKLLPGITAILNQNAADVEALTIRLTPTFFVNGRRLENLGAESLIADMRSAVENAGSG
jgi:protein-disulfide isomerase